MTPPKTAKMSMRDKNLQYKLLIIQVLIFVLPFLTIAYIIYRNDVVLDVSQIFMFSLVLVLVLCGLVILRQIFSGIFNLSNWVKRAEAGDGRIDIRKDTAELHDITVSFNNLMIKFENTTAELQSRIFELFTIKELTELASRSLDIDGLLDLLMEKSMAVTKARIGSVFIVDAENQLFHVAASRGLEFGPRKDSFVKINESLVQVVLSKRKPLLVEDIESDDRTHRENNPKYGRPSFLSMPVFVKEDLIAVLNLAGKETDAVFDTNDEHIVSIMIGEIGFALENARLHSRLDSNLKKLQHHAGELTAVNEKLQQEIAGRKKVEEALRKERNRLKSALAKVKTLSGFLPICADCKKIRDDKGYWNQIEAYIRDHSEAEFSHSICPDCKKRLYAEMKLKKG